MVLASLVTYTKKQWRILLRAAALECAIGLVAQDMQESQRSKASTMYQCATQLSSASNHMTEPARPTTTSHTSMSAAESASSTRFATFVSDEQLAALSKGVTPGNTDKSTRWALSNFESWKQARNKKHPDDLIPDDLLTSNHPTLLTRHLSY